MVALTFKIIEFSGIFYMKAIICITKTIICMLNIASDRQLRNLAKNFFGSARCWQGFEVYPYICE